MKQLILFLIFSISVHAQGDVARKFQLNCVQKSSVRDSSLSLKKAKFTFEFTNLNGSKSFIKYSIDGKSGFKRLKEQKMSISAKPGKHVFQFQYDSTYRELCTDSLEIRGGYHSVYKIHLSRSGQIRQVSKPVIYLYPEKETEVEVKLNIVGTPTFYYPTYTDSWKFTALPSGDLIFGDDTYNYLFWESEMEIAERDWMNEGKIVAREELLVYLESTLEHFHFTSKEKADFITFWAPQMQRHDQTFVRFMFNEECNQFAELNISPTPDQFIRLYILWCPIDSQAEDDYVLQQFPEVEMREGFTVLEWGGMETNPK